MQGWSAKWPSVRWRWVARRRCFARWPSTGFGADPARRKPSLAPAAPQGLFLSDVAAPAELKLWTDRGCITCHGAEARGTQMGPDLTNVLPLYMAKHGSVSAAKTALAAYLIDPQGVPKLRSDGVTFPNPMPAIEKLFGGKREDAAVIADMLLRLTAAVPPK